MNQGDQLNRARMESNVHRISDVYGTIGQMVQRDMELSLSLLKMQALDGKY